MSIIHYTEDL